ncbi:MAG: AIR synthase related protein [Promethearchaeota archaeon]
MNNSQKKLHEFIESIRKFSNIDRKKVIFPLIDRVLKESFSSPNVFRGMGEDSAGIMLNGPEDKFLVLLTTDGINDSFCNKSPWSAGFSAILAGVDDIYACGGFPLAASCIVTSDNPQKRNKIMDGLLDATHRFKVPLVRGHTADNTKNVGVSATVIGKINKEDYISAGGAKKGDLIVIISDFEGKIGKTNKYHWDTVTFKKSDEVLKKREIMNILASKHLIHASKDISNGGIFGTMILMLQYSDKGAVIDIKKMKIPTILKDIGYDSLEYSKMYLTTAFLLAVPPKNIKETKNYCGIYGMNLSEIGRVIKEKQIILQYNGEKAELLALNEL